MRDVLIALCPALIAGCVVFGLRALLVVAVTTAACIFFEWGYEKLCGKPSTICDLSAAVTGVLLAMNLPVSIPLWQAVFGALVAMVAVKGLFGGIGKNFANPAITARIVMFLAFSKSMTAWVFPDAVSSATPLAMMANGESVDYLTLLLGNHGGCLGETERAGASHWLCLSSHPRRDFLAYPGVLRRHCVCHEPDSRAGRRGSDSLGRA